MRTAPDRGRPLTVEEAAARANVPVRMIRRLTGDGRLPSTKVGRYVRIFEGDVNDYLEEQRRA